MTKKKVTIYLTTDIWLEFRARCVRDGDSASEVIESFIREHIGKPLPDMPIGIETAREESGRKRHE